MHLIYKKSTYVINEKDILFFYLRSSRNLRLSSENLAELSSPCSEHVQLHRATALK